MKLFVCKEMTFAAAHRLPRYIGLCANLHGHEWKLEVEVTGHVNHTSGMVIDFVKLKEVMKAEIIDQFDHNDINTIISNPTAENMVTYFVRALAPIMVNFGVELTRIRLYETPTSFCEWRA